MILFLVTFCLLVAVGFGIAAAISDFKSMTIPNIYAACIVLAFIPAYAADALSGNGLEFFASWKAHLLAAGIVFILTFILFSLRIIGAGIQSFAARFALWVGVTGITAFFFYMAITGAVLGLATKIMTRKKVFADPAAGSWIAQSQEGKSRGALWHRHSRWRNHCILPAGLFLTGKTCPAGRVYGKPPRRIMGVG